MAAFELQDVEFFPHDHSYVVDGGRRVPSVTQILKLCGAISYDGIPPAVLENAARRGTAVHELSAMYDRGVDVEAQFDVEPEILPYYRAWVSFCREFEFVAEVDEVERPRVVNVNGIEYAMTPDAPGTIRGGIPVVVDRKATVAKHPCWGLQLAAYEGGLPRPARFRNRQRIAVQLLKDATFKPHVFDDPNDFNVFAHMHGTVMWKLNQRLINLAA